MKLTETIKRVLEKYHHDGCRMDGTCNCNMITEKLIQAVKAYETDIREEISEFLKKSAERQKESDQDPTSFDKGFSAGWNARHVITTKSEELARK